MPESKEYQEIFKLLEQRFNVPAVESLQIAVLIDILATLERMDRKTNGKAYRPRKPKPSQ